MSDPIEREKAAEHARRIERDLLLGKVETQIDKIIKNGVGFRMPAGYQSIFTKEAAESLVGKITKMNAKEFGYDEMWDMRIASAKIVDDGSAIDIVLIPVEK